MIRRNAHRLSLLLVLALAGCAHRPVTVAAPTAPDPRAATKVGSPRTSDPVDRTPTTAAGTLELAAIHFGYDSADLSPEAIGVLDGNLRTLRGAPGLRLLIEGHCDERGTADYNLSLGERRAEAVRTWLRDAGVKGERLRIVSYGKERPFATGHGEEDWRQNRRAQLVAER